MGSKERIGNFISLYEQRNSEKKDFPVVGINRDKTFMPTVANLEGVDTAKYKVISNSIFVFSGMQTGRDICIRIGLYTNDAPALVSPAYTTFTIDTERVLPEYFFMYFNRDESDRYGWFISDSSVRANLDWPRFLDIEIPLPSLEEQQKVVNVWKACREIKEQNEAKAAPLMQLCQSYIQELKHKYPAKEIGPYIEEITRTNSKGVYGEPDVRGVSNDKTMREYKGSLNGRDFRKFLLIKEDEFVFNKRTNAGMGLCLVKDRPYIFTEDYEAFRVVDTNSLLPEFLYLFIVREEFDRYVLFNSWGSSVIFFHIADMKHVSIPIPPLDVQRAIVNIYKCANEAKQIAEEADKLSRAVCPALLQHVIHS